MQCCDKKNNSAQIKLVEWISVKKFFRISLYFLITCKNFYKIFLQIRTKWFKLMKNEKSMSNVLQ